MVVYKILLLSNYRRSGRPLTCPPALTDNDIARVAEIRTILSKTTVPRPSDVIGYSVNFVITASSGVTSTRSFINARRSSNDGRCQTATAKLGPNARCCFYVCTGDNGALMGNPMRSFAARRDVTPVMDMPAIVDGSRAALALDDRIASSNSSAPAVHKFTCGVCVRNSPSPAGDSGMMLNSLATAHKGRSPFANATVGLRSGAACTVQTCTAGGAKAKCDRIVALEASRLVAPVMAVTPPGLSGLASCALRMAKAIASRQKCPIRRHNFY